MQFKVFHRRNALIRFHVDLCAELQSSFLKVNVKKKDEMKKKLVLIVHSHQKMTTVSKVLL